MSDEKTETPAGGQPHQSGRKFVLIWFVIPIVVALVLAFLK